MHTAVVLLRTHVALSILPLVLILAAVSCRARLHMLQEQCRAHPMIVFGAGMLECAGSYTGRTFVQLTPGLLERLSTEYFIIFILASPN